MFKRKKNIDMKKNYLKPEAFITKIEMQQMVCTSMEVNGETNQESDLLSRESDWDD